MINVSEILHIPNPNDTLYFETGFEQLHPLPEIIEWMTEQGYKYKVDWNCLRNNNTYELTFPNKEIAALFSVRWF